MPTDPTDARQSARVSDQGTIHDVEQRMTEIPPDVQPTQEQVAGAGGTISGGSQVMSFAPRLVGRRCPDCGAQLAADAAACPRCGWRPQATLPSGLQQPAQSVAAVDVAILTVLPIELQAAVQALGLPLADLADAQETSPQGSIYYRGVIPGARRSIRFALGAVGEAGNTASALAASEIIARYRPRLLLLVGIAAGMRGKVKIGEVVLSERVWGYEPAALERVGETTVERPRPAAYELPHAIQQAVTHYLMQDVPERPEQQQMPLKLRLRQVFHGIHGSYPTPGPGQEQEFADHVAKTVAVQNATIAAGEKLLRDPGKLVTLRDEGHGRIVAGEMEAHGFAEACHRARVDWLVIRGISDFGDTFKNDAFHAFASYAAAAVMVDYLRHAPNPDGTPTDPPLPPKAAAVLVEAPRHAPKSAPPVNPFGERGKIPPERFFDRDSLLNRIFTELERHQHVSLVGEAQIGKSSLLAMIRHRAPARLKLPESDVALIDMQSISDEKDFFACLCDVLQIIPACRGSKLTGALKGRRVLLALDEIEKLTDQKLFSARVRQELRGLADGRDAPLTLLIASRLPLERLFPDRPGDTSPLANICEPISVPPFDEATVRAFLAARLHGTGVAFSEDDIIRVIRQSAGKPADVQRHAAECFRQYVETL